MKENNKLSELTLEELNTKKKKLTSAAIGIGIVMLIACAALFYFAVNNKNYALIVVAVGCGMTLLPSVVILSQINNEIKSRK